MTAPVLHVDLDQFLAAVEVQRHPELAGRPVVVGGRGDPTERGVVSTASYEARAFGVRSGMPLRVAARRCPEAVFLPVDKPVYEEASDRVMETLRALRWGGDPVDVQVLGWDEAFVGVRAPVEGAGRDPLVFAQHVRAEVLAATGLHCSVGIGDTLVQVKIATDFGKPQGVFRISDETWFAQMGDRSTRSLWGVGSKTAQRLEGLGITTVADLARADPHLLAAELGPTTGPWLRRLGRGAGSATVDPTPWVPRAHGREETFQADLDDPAEVAAAVRRLAARALADIDAAGRPAARVGLKIRWKPFLTATRSLTLPEPTRDETTLVEAALTLLARVDRVEGVHPRDREGAWRPVRLLGVRLEMTPPRTTDGGPAPG